MMILLVCVCTSFLQETLRAPTVSSAYLVSMATQLEEFHAYRVSAPHWPTASVPPASLTPMTCQPATAVPQATPAGIVTSAWMASLGTLL